MARCGRTAVFAAGVAALCGAIGQAAAADRLIEGELVRVDLGRRRLVLRPAGGPAREMDVAVDGATTITASGRVLALEELKPVERIAVSCDATVSPACRARRERAGPVRHAPGPAGPP
jgi:hypothetical protein